MRFLLRQTIAVGISALTFLAAPGISAGRSANPPAGATHLATASALLLASDFGLAADGRTDDGPAIARMLQKAKAQPGPVEIKFPADKVIAVKSAGQPYAFWLQGMTNLVIDGAGCEFRLAPEVRFMRLIGSSNVTVRNLQIDFTPLPFVDGDVVRLHPGKRLVEVRLYEPNRATDLGGPTRRDGEQDFFGMLWVPGPHDLTSQHLYVQSVTPVPRTRQPGMVRVQVPEKYPFPEIRDFLKANSAWKISLPVPGIAHRFGPGANIVIEDNHDVVFENVETWSAPWFAFNIARNSGALRFEKVHVRPKPGTGRLTSSWRDGFHVKGNRASLLFDGCILAGMNDDAFNISTHCSRVTEVHSPTRLTVLQYYSLGFIPFQAGGLLRIMDATGGTVLGEAEINAVSGGPSPVNSSRARPVQLELRSPIHGVEKGAIAWETTSANPKTVLRNCVIRNSCRFQSSVEIERCDITALSWFYGAVLEGPGPERVSIRDSILRRGRGNRTIAVSFSGWAAERSATATSARLPLREVILTGNRIYGNLIVRDAESLTLEGNTFEDGMVELERCRKVIRKH